MDRTMQGFVDGHTATSNRQRDLEKRIREMEAECDELREAIKQAHTELGKAGETSFRKLTIAADRAFSILGAALEGK